MTRLAQRLLAIFILINLFIPQFAFADSPVTISDSPVTISDSPVIIPVCNNPATATACENAGIVSNETGITVRDDHGQIILNSTNKSVHSASIGFSSNALDNLVGYNGEKIGVTHIADDGTITHYIEALKRPLMGKRVNKKFNFSTIIISGLTGTTIFSESDMSGNYTKSFNEVNVSSVAMTITNHQSDTDAYGNDLYIDISPNESMISGSNPDLPLQAYFNISSGVSTNGSNVRVYYINGTEISCEIESYINNNLSIFFKPAITDNVTNVTYRLQYGNISAPEHAADSMYGSEAVWDNAATYHMNQEPNDVSLNDSTNNNNDATTTAFTVNSLVDTDFGKGVSFDGSAEYADTGILPNTSQDWTMLVHGRVTDKTDLSTFLGTIRNAAPNYYRMFMGLRDTQYYSGWGVRDTTANEITNDVDFVYVHTANGSSNVGETFIDGSSVDTGSDANSQGQQTQPVYIGALNLYGSPAQYTSGIFNEVRLYNFILSDNFILTTSNNLNNPTASGVDAFYKSIGDQQQIMKSGNITTSVTGDTNTTNYTTDIPQTHTLTPSANITEIVFNTTSTNWDYTATLYWTEDTTEDSQTYTNGYVKSFINHTPANNVTTGIFNTTISAVDISTLDAAGTLSATLNGANVSENATRDDQIFNLNVTNLTGGQNYLINFTLPVNTNFTASVSEQTFSTTQDVSVVFTATDAVDNNALAIFGTLNDTTKTTTSPHNFGTMAAGTYTYYLNITEDATVSPHTENLTATINVIQSYGSVPSIQDGVYAYHYSTTPQESEILARQTDGLVTVDMAVDFDTLNASTWSTILSRISYAYDNNIRTSLHLDMYGNYTSQAYIDGVKNNVSTYLNDLTTDPYQTNTQFITLNFTNTSASEADKVSFANTIGLNISVSTNSKFKTITREQLTGLDTAWVDNTPIRYIDLTTKAQWIDDEASTYRAATTKSRIYSNNTSFISDITTYRNEQLMKARGTSDTDNQFSEISTVKLTNGDFLLYNNVSATQNMTIQNVNNGTYFDITNDVYFNLTADGEIYFDIGAESIAYIMKDSFGRIDYEDNTTSNLINGVIISDNIIDYGNTSASTPPASYLWGGVSTDIKYEFYDPYYTTDNTFMIHYEWLNASVVTDYSQYDHIIIADQNGDEINSSFSTTNNLYGYVAVFDYVDSDGWEASKIVEIDVWIDTYDTNIFLDGIDSVTAGTNFSARLKNLVDHTRVDKDKEIIMNTYTAYEVFSTYGDMVMKESAFSRWDGDVNTPTYSWENMSIEKERADFYTSHNIPVLGMSFGAVDDYSKQTFDSFAFAVLYGFDGENSWRYGQPNFQTQKELSIYPFGTMLEDTYTEHSSTDWSRLYSGGRVHINPVNHTYSIEDNLHVNSIKFNMSLYKGAAAVSGDVNVYIHVNENATAYTIPFIDGVDPVATWVDRQINISTSDYNDTGHYNIYAYTLRSGLGGWNFIGEEDITGIGTHTWYDTTGINVPDNFTGQTWNALQRDRNFMGSFSTNVTTSATLDTISDKITQSDSNLTYNTTTVINSTEIYDIPLWSGIVTITDTFENATTYFKAQNGSWVSASVNTVTYVAGNVIDWAYTTIDNKIYGVARQMVSATEYIYRYLFPDITTTQEVYTEALPTIQNLTSLPNTDHIYFDWDDYPGADYFNIYELEESAPYINTSITLDAIKDSVYDDYSHAFIISTPHQVSPSNYETIYWFRNDTHLIGYADGFDADSLSNDDSFKLGVDNTGNGLTTDDRQFILREGGSVSAKRWSGSTWLPQSTNAEGIVVGSGGGGAIQYEMIIPLSEMAGFVDGVTAKFMMERKCTSLNPDVSTYFPETLINDTDGTLWATAELTIGEEYVYVGNSTISYYESANLTAFTWYKHNITAVNGVDESAGTFSTDITLDYPKYTVSGYIKDITGTPIQNATVWSRNGIVTEHDISNATGYYSGEHFHNGTYRIFANATGYATNNTTAFTIAGANITNKNITLIESVSDNLVNFTFTNLAYTTPIKEYESSTITVDINDSDGTITSAIIKIHGSNHTMQYISGDQWRYIYSSGIITNHYITNIYATDNASGTNSTTYTTDYISILSRAGAGGGGGGVALPPQDEEEEDVPEVTIPTNVSDAVDFVENITKGIGNIISGDSFSMLRINTNPFQPSYAKTIMISGVVDATSTDPNVDVGAVNNEVIVITRPPLDNSLYFKYDTSIDIVLDTGIIEHRDYSVLVIDLMTYIPVKEFVMQNANPYIFKPLGVSSVEGVRIWWIVMLVVGGGIIVSRKRGKKE